MNHNFIINVYSRLRFIVDNALPYLKADMHAKKLDTSLLVNIAPSIEEIINNHELAENDPYWTLDRLTVAIGYVVNTLEYLSTLQNTSFFILQGMKQQLEDVKYIIVNDGQYEELAKTNPDVIKWDLLRKNAERIGATLTNIINQVMVSGGNNDKKQEFQVGISSLFSPESWILQAVNIKSRDIGYILENAIYHLDTKFYLLIESESTQALKDLLKISMYFYSVRKHVFNTTGGSEDTPKTSIRLNKPVTNVSESVLDKDQIHTGANYSPNNVAPIIEFFSSVLGYSNPTQLEFVYENGTPNDPSDDIFVKHPSSSAPQTNWPYEGFPPGGFKQRNNGIIRFRR
jgi:hypothetical protein